MDPLFARINFVDSPAQAAEVALGQSPAWARLGETIGIHVYSRSSNPELILGTIRINNGTGNPDGTGFCGKLYCDSIVIDAPANYRWVTLGHVAEWIDAENGRLYVLAPPERSGDSHLLRPGLVLERRFALIRDEAHRRDAIAALLRKGMTLPETVQNYGPAMSRLPKVDRAAREMTWTGRQQALLHARETGERIFITDFVDVQQTAIGGVWWLEGVDQAGEPGGYKINPSHGFEQCRASVVCNEILHEASMERQFCALYNAKDGEPIRLEQWVRPPSRDLLKGEPFYNGENEFWFFLEGDYDNRRYKSFNRGTCPYEADLWRFRPRDLWHYSRVLNHAIVLAEHGGDRCAKDDLIMLATWARSAFWSDRSDEVAEPDNPNDYVRPSLRHTLAKVTANQHHGSGDMDRGFAWMMVAGACALKYETSAMNKQLWFEWGVLMLDAAMTATDHFGFQFRTWNSSYMPDTVGGIQTFHQGLVLVGMFTLARQLGRTWVSMIAPKMAAACVSMYTELDARPYGTAMGPPHWIGTQVDDRELAELYDSYAYGEGDPAHVLAACALTYRAVASDDVLHMALKHWHPHITLQDRLTWLKDPAVGDDRRAWGAEMEVAIEGYLGK